MQSIGIFSIVPNLFSCLFSAWNYCDRAFTISVGSQDILDWEEKRMEQKEPTGLPGVWAAMAEDLHLESLYLVYGETFLCVPANACPELLCSCAWLVCACAGRHFLQPRVLVAVPIEKCDHLQSEMGAWVQRGFCFASLAAVPTFVARWRARITDEPVHTFGAARDSCCPFLAGLMVPGVYCP